jgi:hypothetical protein
MRPMRVIRFGVYATLLLTAVLIVDILVLVFYFDSVPERMARSGGPNALWAEHEWVGEVHTDAEYDALARQLQANRITDVFFHVGPLAADGTIDPALYPNAAALIAALEIRLPDLRAQAWIGQKEKLGGGPLDIEDPAVRGAIVETARSFLELGFDGIHYNIEPVASGNRDLLALLDETRPVVDANDAVLSIAADEIEPYPGVRRMLKRFFPDAQLWSADYYQAISERTDQMAVMMYDTALPFAWAYSAVVSWITRVAWHNIRFDTVLFIGVPTYDEATAGFDPAAENLESALTGIARTMSSDHDAPETFGLAIYANWTTDEDEWAFWRRHWLGESE